ncbi:MAG: DUF6036 family nucleotidyltransferase [Elusimicrobiales bacterium]
MNSYRIGKDGLLETMSAWNALLKRRVHLIACGGTAMTLLGVKESTKDIDFIVPDEKEYIYLAKRLAGMGYGRASEFGWSNGGNFIFDLYPGSKVYQTELLESPLETGNNTLFREFERIYIGILNPYDIIITKLFRASAVDIDDCAGLVKAAGKELDWAKLESRFRETASYSVFEDRANGNFNAFRETMKRRKLI